MTMKSKSKSESDCLLWAFVLWVAIDPSSLDSECFAVDSVTGRQSPSSSSVLERSPRSLDQFSPALWRCAASRVQTSGSRGACPPRFREPHPPPVSERGPQTLVCSDTESRRGPPAYKWEEDHA